MFIENTSPAEVDRAGATAMGAVLGSFGGLAASVLPTGLLMGLITYRVFSFALLLAGLVLAASAWPLAVGMQATGGRRGTLLGFASG